MNLKTGMGAGLGVAAAVMNRRRRMTSMERRRLWLALYGVAMVLLSGWILSRLFAPGELVRIYDREEVMRLRSPAILTEVTVEDDCWRNISITDPDLLFQLNQWLGAIPLVRGEFPGEAPGKISGTFYFADGSKASYEVGKVLTMDGAVYYSKRTEDELEELHECLSNRLYTLENLATFFEADHQVYLTDGVEGRNLSPEEMGLLEVTIRQGELVDDLEEVEQAVSDRTPRYTIYVRDLKGTEQVGVWVYANEATQVYDAYGNGQRRLLCFSSQLVPLCQNLLEIGS